MGLAENEGDTSTQISRHVESCNHNRWLHYNHDLPRNTFKTVTIFTQKSVDSNKTHKIQRRQLSFSFRLLPAAAGWRVLGLGLC